MAASRTPRVVNVLLLGFGNVGRAFARMVLAKAADLRATTAAGGGLEIRMVGISTSSHGCIYNRDGAAVDLAACLALVEAAQQSSSSWRLPSSTSGSSESVDSTETLLRAAKQSVQDGELHLDAVLECITTPDYSTGEPALSYLMRAITELDCHAVTASKGPVLCGFQSLTAAATEHGKRFLYESSVMDGVPVFSFARAMMPGCAIITGCDGILNSTTNIILTEMEEKQCSFANALATAQRDGIAERNPSGDIDGHDAAIKIALLATVLLGAKNLTLAEVDISTAGIGAITLDDINAAASRGARLKVICSCSVGDEEGGSRADGIAVSASVKLVEIPRTDALSAIAGASSVVRLTFESLAPISIVSHDPLNVDTAFGLFNDLLTAVRRS